MIWSKISISKNVFCFFEGIQFLTCLANRHKNLKNGKTLRSFVKYSSNIFSQNFPVRRSAKRKFIPVLFSCYFFHYVNGRYTMRYYIQRYTKTFWNNETIKYIHATTLSNELLWNFKIDKIISWTKATKIFWSN